MDNLLNELRGSIGTPLQKGEWDAIRHFGEQCRQPFDQLNKAIAGPDIARVERIATLQAENERLLRQQQNLVLQACLHVRHHEGALVDCTKAECAAARAALAPGKEPQMCWNCQGRGTVPVRVPVTRDMEIDAGMTPGSGGYTTEGERCMECGGSGEQTQPEPPAPEEEVYCPHMRPGGWKSCPHCSGVNSAVPQSSEPEKGTE